MNNDSSSGTPSSLTSNDTNQCHLDGKGAQLFLAQLGSITENDVHSHFNQYGKIIKSSFYHDYSHSSLSHGYIILPDFESAEKALEDRPHCIKGRKILCRPMWNQPYKTGADARNFQVFVVGFSSRISVSLMKEYFSRFGEVYDIALTERPVHNRYNGLAVVTFIQKESVEKVLAAPKHFIENNSLRCLRVLSLAELRATAPRVESRYNEENCREQPRTALVDDQPLQTVPESMEPQISQPNTATDKLGQENGSICDVAPALVPAEVPRMTGVQTEDVTSMGRGRALVQLLKLKSKREAQEARNVPNDEPMPDWTKMMSDFQDPDKERSQGSCGVIFSLNSHFVNSRPIVFHTKKQAFDQAVASANPPLSSGRGNFVAVLNSSSNNSD